MHVPDHFLNDPVAITTFAVAGAGLAWSALKARREHTFPVGDSVTGAASQARPSMAPRVTPATFAATSALVFGLQMLNYPVAAGTSGHVLGAALAAALLGPAWGVLSMTAVITVQAFVFADGGLSALGTNVLLMALVGTVVGWGVHKGLTGLAARRGSTRPVWLGATAGAGALAATVAASAVFVGLFAIGGTVSVPLGALASQMLGLHALIGLGEAIVTAGIVAAVAAWAPGFVALDTRPAALPLVSLRRRAAVALGGLAMVAAGLLSPWAASTPDGLEATAQAVGFAGAARDHVFAGAPLADYGAAGGLSVQLVGIIGLAVCAISAVALFGLLAPRRRLAAAAA